MDCTRIPILSCRINPMLGTKSRLFLSIRSVSMFWEARELNILWLISFCILPWWADTKSCLVACLSLSTKWYLEKHSPFISSEISSEPFSSKTKNSALPFPLLKLLKISCHTSSCYPKIYTWLLSWKRHSKAPLKWSARSEFSIIDLFNSIGLDHLQESTLPKPQEYLRASPAKP